MWKTRCRRCSKVHMITQPCPICQAAEVAYKEAEDAVKSEVEEKEEEG